MSVGQLVADLWPLLALVAALLALAGAIYWDRIHPVTPPESPRRDFDTFLDVGGHGGGDSGGDGGDGGGGGD